MIYYSSGHFSMQMVVIEITAYRRKCSKSLMPKYLNLSWRKTWHGIWDSLANLTVGTSHKVMSNFSNMLLLYALIGHNWSFSWITLKYNSHIYLLTYGLRNWQIFNFIITSGQIGPKDIISIRIIFINELN